MARWADAETFLGDPFPLGDAQGWENVWAFGPQIAAKHSP